MLAELDGKPVRTFVIWEPVLATDWSSPSTAMLRRISNRGAAQFWDRGRLISHSMGEHGRRGIVWDHIALYPPGAIWEERPPQPHYAGRPVVRVIDKTRAALVQAFKGDESQAAGSAK